MVEFETYDDLKRAVSSLDRTEFKGAQVTCIADVVPVSQIHQPFSDFQVLINSAGT